MSRFEIATGKFRDKEPEETVQIFGFDSDFDKKRRKRIPPDDYFKLQDNEVARAGIVYEDPKKLFTGTHVHFCKTYFLCKSTEGNKMPCCNYSKRVFRIGCALIIYRSMQSVREGVILAPPSLTGCSGYQIKPWIFGLPVYKILKELHKKHPVFDHDLRIKCTTSQIFKKYDIMPIVALRPHSTKGYSSLWRRCTPETQKEIIDEARPIIENMKNYIAADLSNEEIEELVKSAPRQDQSRPNIQNQSRPDLQLTGIDLRGNRSRSLPYTREQLQQITGAALFPRHREDT